MIKMGLIRRLGWTALFGFGFVAYTGYVFNIGREYEANERNRNHPRINMVRRLTDDALNAAEGISDKVDYCTKKIEEFSSKDSQKEQQQTQYSNEMDELRDDLETKLEQIEWFPDGSFDIIPETGEKFHTKPPSNLK